MLPITQTSRCACVPDRFMANEKLSLIGRQARTQLVWKLGSRDRETVALRPAYDDVDSLTSIDQPSTPYQTTNWRLEGGNV